MTSGHDGSEQTMGTRILLVEDDPSSQDLIRALCESRGDQVDTAADGFLGLRLLSERRHDVALIDYHLPEMDGYALARLMREIARPEGRLRLVGITADRHGLASRRGADTLFDAILVKPLEPALLFETLDRLMRPEPVAASVEAAPADALWRRRGLPGRPRALHFPAALPPQAVEALSQAFLLVENPLEAEIVLVADASGLDALRSLRTDGAAAFLPSVALTPECAQACDLVFQVGDPDSWSALATTCRGFAARRAALVPGLDAAPDAAQRLLALLAVADRGLILNSGEGSEALPYETGHSPASRMAAVLALAEEAKLVCEPSGDGVAVRLTELGRSSVIGQTVELARALPAGGSVRPAGDRQREEARLGAATMPGWRAPKVVEAPLAADEAEAGRATGSPIGADAHARPITDPCRIAELERLIGPDQIVRLKQRLARTLETGFDPGAEPAALAREAHVMIAMAGSLGFERLAEGCRGLEAAIAAGRDHRGDVESVRRASTEVRAACAAAGA